MHSEILGRLPEEELESIAFEINRKYAGQRYRNKKDGELYEVFGATIISKDHRAWWGITYHKVNELGRTNRNIPFTHTLEEFFNGNFELAK